MKGPLIERGAADRIAHWREHPSVMVKELFHVDPDPWQEEALEAFPSNPRIAMKACKGPGKTGVLAWLGWNYLLTRPHPKIGAISVTATNLADGLWTEMAKWQNESTFLKAKFEWTKSRIFAKDHPETWFMSAKSWSQSADATQQANTLAGFHADYVMFLIDESGSMPTNILVAAEASFAGTKEAHIVQAGNPESLEGMLYHAATKARHLWHVIEITGDPDDPKRSPRIPIEYAREQIAQWGGRDNPWVMVNILGKFPPASLNALIGYEEVREAMKRYYRDYEIGNSARVIGVDVALDGGDQSVIAKRHGLQFHPFKKYRNIAPHQGAGVVAREWQDWGADAVFIDATGGFGSGWLDQLMLLGRSPIGIKFSSDAAKKERYFNKRAEMAFEFVEWIKRGGALPDDTNLASSLASTTYSFKGDRFLLEPKIAVKAKIGFSPDEMDACMLTFAQPVVPLGSQQILRPRTQAPYDPFAEFDRVVADGRRESRFDPFA